MRRIMRPSCLLLHVWVCASTETSPRGLSREQSIDIQGFYCWKPQPREKEMIAILVAFKDGKLGCISVCVCVCADAICREAIYHRAHAR